MRESKADLFRFYWRNPHLLSDERNVNGVLVKRESTHMLRSNLRKLVFARNQQFLSERLPRYLCDLIHGLISPIATAQYKITVIILTHAQSLNYKFEGV